MDYGVQASVWGKIRVQSKRYLAAIRRIWWLLPLTVSMGACIAAWFVSQLPPAYMSTGRMIYAGQYSLGSVYSDQSNNYFGTQQQILESGNVREEALTRVETLHPNLKPEDVDLNDRAAIVAALKKVTAALRPWTIDFHVAQNDGTVKGQGSHDKTGRHCQPDDPNGRMDIVEVAGLWMRDENGTPTKAFQHICWDGCMFSNDVMTSPATWNKVLATMIQVRDAHGWD